jgi:hypothetical protein
VKLRSLTKELHNLVEVITKMNSDVSQANYGELSKVSYCSIFSDAYCYVLQAFIECNRAIDKCNKDIRMAQGEQRGHQKTQQNKQQQLAEKKFTNVEAEYRQMVVEMKLIEYAAKFSVLYFS